MLTGSEVIAQTVTQTDTKKQTHRHTDMMKTLPLLHTQEVKCIHD